MKDAGVLQERIARQGLVSRSSGTVAHAAALSGAIQAQDAAASRLGIRARSARTEAEVIAAIAETRTVTRTWLMRGTIHLVDSVDLRWMVRLFGPGVAAKLRSRWRQLGLTDDVLARAAGLLPEVLGGAPMTRAQIRDALAERGMQFESADTQVHTHVLVYASAIGLVCRAQDNGRDATFTLLENWCHGSPGGPSGDDALAEITRRYFAAFSPATPADFVVWSGLAAGPAVELIRAELTPVEVFGRPGFRLGEVEPARGVTLLPAFDNYLIGYREREAMLATPLRGRVYEGGMIRASVVVDGRIVGVWSLARPRDPVRVTVTAFEPLTRRVVRGIEKEAADVARFLDRPATLEIIEPR